MMTVVVVACAQKGRSGQLQVPNSPSPVVAMSWNIRYDNPADGIHAWPNRRERVVDVIRRSDPDIIALQEVVVHQLDFLRDSLPDYRFAGVGRDDGRSRGEFCPLAFRTSRFERLGWGMWWLSETPTEPSRGWDAALPRIATWTRLRDRETDADVFVVSVHFDHRGEVARSRSADLLAQLLEGESNVILMGDFNAVPGSYAHRVLSESMNDAAGENDAATWCGWDGEADGGRRIDWILFRGVDRVSYEIPPWQDSSTPESDHFPVIARLRHAPPIR